MVYYELAGMKASFHGPSGVLLPLGVELVVKSLPQITAIYNYFSIFMLLILAIVSSQRDTKFMSILITRCGQDFACGLGGCILLIRPQDLELS